MIVTITAVYVDEAVQKFGAQSEEQKRKCGLGVRIF